jgi:SM-20-related protein
MSSCSEIINDIALTGWSVTRNFLPEEAFNGLTEEINILWREGEFRKAGVGRGENLKLRPEIRTDHVHWLDPENLPPSVKPYWDKIEILRNELNENLFLGLQSFEGHFAAYSPGSYYKKHLDQFKDVKYRIISCILYLNKLWDENSGGQLRIYEDETSERFTDIYPHPNTFVCFRSDTVYHEVLPTTKQRYSLTGWLRRRELLP